MASSVVAKMCVLIYLRVFSWLICGIYIYIYIQVLEVQVYHTGYQTCFASRRETGPREANADAAQDIYLLYYRAITENRCRRGIETAYRA